jgi:DNA-directed RNA polymerase subunit M/transcription elongation factor TFIIS
LPYDPALAGKKCRCGKCGKVFTVPTARDFETEKSPSPPPTTPAQPKYVEFWCRVCDTRLVAFASDAGKKAKCPDCGAINPVPAPRAVQPRREPPAMHGQQYGVWEVNRAPDPAEMRAKQPRLFPVYCRVCDTLMYALMKHVGGSLKCPDCGALTKVLPPPPEPEKKSVLVPDGEEYQLDPTEVVKPASRQEHIQKLAEKGKREADEVARKRAEERPPMPHWPTVQGIWELLLVDPVPKWWVGTSTGGIVVAWFILASIATQGGGPFEQMFAIMCRIFAALGILLWSGPVCSSLCAVLVDSAEGLRKMHSQPGIFFTNCIREVAHVFFSISVSMVPTLAVMKFVPWQFSLAMGGVTMLLFFPVFLLSTLQESTPMGIFSPKVWGSLVRRPLHWVLFYGQSALLAALTVVTVFNLVQFAPGWGLAAVPIALATLYVYFRLVGRLAWWLAESLSEEMPQTENPYRQSRLDRD